MLNHYYQNDLLTEAKINRCFGNKKYDKIQIENHVGIYERAQLIVQAIKDVNPEMVVDLHNTPSPCPTFAISPKVTAETISLASFFAKH